jgi:hypothetical protein
VRRLLLLPALALGLAACGGGKTARNYKKCLKLRVGMSGFQVEEIMGKPDETFPYVEGKSLPHMKGKTAFEWANPASMSAPNRVTLSEESGVVESIRCGDTVVTATVFVEPPAPPEDAALPPGLALPATGAAEPPPEPAAKPLVETHSGPRASGQPLTGD